MLILYMESGAVKYTDGVILYLKRNERQTEVVSTFMQLNKILKGLIKIILENNTDLFENERSIYMLDQYMHATVMYPDGSFGFDTCYTQTL